MIKQWWRNRRIKREGKRLRKGEGKTVVARIQVETKPTPQPWSKTVLGRPENVQVHRNDRVNQEGAHLHTLLIRAKQGNTEVVFDVDDPLELMHELAQGWFWICERDKETQAKTPANRHKRGRGR